MEATNQQQQQPAAGHFYLSSVATWMTTGTVRTLSEAVRLMDKEAYTYGIWYVPMEATADYEIRMYAPQVEGAVFVELVEFKNGRKVKAK